MGAYVHALDVQHSRYCPAGKLNEVSRLVDEGVLRTTMTERYSLINAANLKHVHMLIESSKARAKSYWKASTPLLDRGYALGI